MPFGRTSLKNFETVTKPSSSNLNLRKYIIRDTWASISFIFGKNSKWTLSVKKIFINFWKMIPNDRYSLRQTNSSPIKKMNATEPGVILHCFQYCAIYHSDIILEPGARNLECNNKCRSSLVLLIITKLSLKISKQFILNKAQKILTQHFKIR